MSVKRIISIVLLSIIIFGVGVYFGRVNSHFPFENKGNIEQKDKIIKEIKKTIDSLEIVVFKYDSINRNLKDSIHVIEIIRPIKIEAIKELPTDSGVLWLKQKLGEYEK